MPDRRDIVWIDFDPQKGREIKKKHPAFTISPRAYNEKTKLALCMPITSKVKNYPFEAIVNEKEIVAAILSDQIRSLDLQAREANFIAKCPLDVFNEVIFKFRLLMV